MNKNKRLPSVIALDIVLAGLGLIVFALFHHVIPQEGTTEGVLINNTVYAEELTEEQKEAQRSSIRY